MLFTGEAIKARKAEKWGLLDFVVPDDAWFVGGYHDTASEFVELFDVDRVPASLGGELAKARNKERVRIMDLGQNFMTQDIFTIFEKREIDV